jgi:hypothetical protein
MAHVQIHQPALISPQELNLPDDIFSCEETSDFSSLFFDNLENDSFAVNVITSNIGDIFPDQSFNGKVEPRLVSRSDLIEKASKSTSQPVPTPYDSLRSLIKRRQNIVLEKRGRDGKESTIEPQSKKAKSLSVESALHIACCNPRVTVEEVDQILRMDPQAASRSVAVTSKKVVYNPICRGTETKSVKEVYRYPINIAIKNKASAAVIAVLIESAPSVLSIKDGSAQETSLAVLIRNAPEDLANIDKMLLANPHCIQGADRHGNTATHVACTSGASLNIVRHLCIMYPESLEMRNRHFKTPYELSQQRISASSDGPSPLELVWLHTLLIPLDVE